MDKTQIVELMRSYDFIQNSVSSFARQYNISARTVSNYMKELNIIHKQSGLKTHKNRDKHGRFTFSKNEIDTPEKKTSNKIDLLAAQDKPRIRSFKEYSKKYDVYYSPKV